MTENEKQNFTNMANAFEAHIEKLNLEIESLTARHSASMERRMKDKIELGKLKTENDELLMRLKLNEFIIDDLLNKVEELEARLGVENPMPSVYPAYCNTGKELK
jgi:predicted nuclease with TOPRIM domain